IRKISKKILISIGIINLITLPILWLAYPYLISLAGIFWSILIAEIIVVLIEGEFIHLFNRNRISIGQAFLLALITNLVSFIFGLWLF
ncbi:MAG: hypothetical protein V1692_01910, partial [bacterium]